MENNSDFICPRCDRALRPEIQRPGTIWVCDGCNGRAIGLSLLRQLFTDESTNLLWANAVDGNGNAKCGCPSCEMPMQEVNATSGLRVDVCTRCQFVWLDMGEVEKFTKRSAFSETRALPEEAQEILGKALLKQISQKAEAEALAERLSREARYSGMSLHSGWGLDYLSVLLLRLVRWR